MGKDVYRESGLCSTHNFILYEENVYNNTTICHILHIWATRSSTNQKAGRNSWILIMTINQRNLQWRLAVTCHVHCPSLRIADFLQEWKKYHCYNLNRYLLCEYTFLKKGFKLFGAPFEHCTFYLDQISLCDILILLRLKFQKQLLYLLVFYINFRSRTMIAYVGIHNYNQESKRHQTFLPFNSSLQLYIYSLLFISSTLPFIDIPSKLKLKFQK